MVLHLILNRIMVSLSSLTEGSSSLSLEAFCTGNMSVICKGEIEMLKVVLLRLDFNLFFPSHATCARNRKFSCMVR